MTLLLACAAPVDTGLYEPDPGHEGTAVGNPGNLGMTADPEVEVSASVGTVVLWACEGEDELLAVDADVVLPAELVELPAGTWCGLEVELEALTVDGEAVGPATPGHGERFTVDGQDFLLELDLVDATASTLWVDVDGDGLVDAQIDEPPQVASADPGAEVADAYAKDGGCGCGGGLAGSWLVVLVLLALRRRAG